MPDGEVIEYLESDRIRDVIANLEREVSVDFRSESNPDYPRIITPKRFVNVYLHDRAYGGPQEGGWWFDYYEPQEADCREFTTQEEAEAFLDKAQTEADDENANRRSDIGSVLSEGCFEVVLEAWAAEHYPKRRPVYC
jgi:hypothetical protein